MINALSIDVEEYFHPTEVQAFTGGPDNWIKLPSRLQQPMDRILDLLDRHNVKATFFILGWVAERHPRLVVQIANAGHQMGCHSYAHQLVYDLTPSQFRKDTKRAIQVIEGHACGINGPGCIGPRGLFDHHNVDVGVGDPGGMWIYPRLQHLPNLARSVRDSRFWKELAAFRYSLWADLGDPHRDGQAV